MLQKSPKLTKRELPKIWSRNWEAQQLTSKDNNIFSIEKFRTTDQRADIDSNNEHRSISPVEKYMIQRNRKMTQESLYKMRTKSVSQQQTINQEQSNLQRISNKRDTNTKMKK